MSLRIFSLALMALVSSLQAGEKCVPVPAMFASREVWRISHHGEPGQGPQKVKMIGKAWKLNRVGILQLDGHCARPGNTAKTFLESQGISFYPGSLAQYDAGRGQLHLLLGASQMELAGALIEYWNQSQFRP